jgi:hypothetical protein
MTVRAAQYLCFLLLFFSACYSFKGISVDPDVRTFYVRNFENIAGNAPPTLALDFTEKLKDKIRAESRLVLNSETPDVEFTGRVTSFVVVPVAPKPGEVVSLNQLKISVAIKYVNNKNEKKSWTSERTKSHFAEFSNTTDLLSVQEELIRQISTQILDDIFNEAFNDW